MRCCSGVSRFEVDKGARSAGRRIPTDAHRAGCMIHSLNDPQAAVEHQYEYREGEGGSNGNLVQAYTDEPSHTGKAIRN